MAHIFEKGGVKFLVDSSSGSVFEVSDVLAFLLQKRDIEPSQQFADYPQELLNEAEEEINVLINEGVLFSKEEDAACFSTKTAVKALCLNVAHDCNLRCGYCFAGEGVYDGGRGLMPYEVALNAVDMLIEKSGTRKNLEIDFFGGEPLMNLDVVKKTVEYANSEAKKHGKEFRFTITTNGLLLNKETAEYLNDVMDNVVISLDGRREIHNLVRKTVNGKDVFDKIISNALDFVKIRGERDYYVRGTFTALNLDFTKDVEYLLSLGFKKISLEPVVLPENHPLAIREEHLPKIFAEYDKLSELYIREHQEGSPFVFFHFQFSFDNAPCLRKVVTACGAGCEYLAVSPDGGVYPCHQFVGKSDFCLGKTTTKLNEKAMEKLEKSSVYTKNDCKSCWAKYFCSGGCLANNYNFNQNIDIPHQTTCEIMRKRLECTIYVNNVINKLD